MGEFLDQKTQKEIRDMFNERLARDIDIVVHSIGSEDIHEFARQFPQELSELSGKISVEHLPVHDAMVDPSLTIGKKLGYKFSFLGSPYGHEAATIVETVCLLSQGHSSLSPKAQKALQRLDKDVKIQVFATPSCPYCPQAALLGVQVMLANPNRVSVEVVEAQENQALAAMYRVSSVPQQVINGDVDSITIGVQREQVFVEQVIRYGSSDADSILAEMKEKGSSELPKQPQGEIELTAENFDAALTQYPRLAVDFWAEWCMPCKMMAPIFKDLADSDDTVVYAKCNIDENPEIAQRYSIATIPTIGVFKSGQLLKEIVGVKPKNQLAEEIHLALG